MFMKKILFLLLIILCTGCSSLNKKSIDEIVTLTESSELSITNTYRAGYKYYLPKGLKLLNHEGSNELFSMNQTIFYMYVDRVSYFHKVKEEYQEKTDVVYSKTLSKNDLFGYIEIKNTENDKYFIEIMYNYAKIEVIVEKKKMEEAIAYAMSILTSIEYQEDVLKSLMGEDILKSNEVEHNIFESAETESGYLKIVEEYGTYEEKKEDVVDPDFIRR